MYITELDQYEVGSDDDDDYWTQWISVFRAKPIVPIPCKGILTGRSRLVSSLYIGPIGFEPSNRIKEQITFISSNQHEGY